MLEKIFFESPEGKRQLENPSNASKWQMGFNLAFKGLKPKVMCFVSVCVT
jgi:hypothetical protein